MTTWKPVVGHEGRYEVSDEGQVRSVKTGRLLAGGVSGRYRNVSLRKDGKTVVVRVQHLVLEAFVGPRPEGAQCRHLNDVGLDNRLANLSWGTKSENAHDAVRNGRAWGPKKTHCPAGHAYTPENTRLIRDTSRKCRTCDREQAAASRARARA